MDINKLRYKSWSEEEDLLLREEYARSTYLLLGRRLGRSPDAVKSRCIMLGLTRPGGCIADNRRDDAYMKKVWRELYG